MRGLVDPLCRTTAATSLQRKLGMVMGLAKMDHRTLLTGTHLTLTGARARREPGWARMQHLPTHAKTRTEGRP